MVVDALGFKGNVLGRDFDTGFFVDFADSGGDDVFTLVYVSSRSNPISGKFFFVFASFMHEDFVFVNDVGFY